MNGLLGRDLVKFDARGEYLAGKRVLITGAGGSIGSELAALVDRYEPDELILFGHGESTLVNTNARISDHGRVEIGDIRDLDRVAEVFEWYQPQVVLHTAALKHQPILERTPREAYLTNVLGTSNVLEAAKQAGTERLVNVSTDKAADPKCVLGASKRIAELMTAACGWPSVRFGNVIGSRGSVLWTFARQLAEGGRLTITSPDVDRFFMTGDEAARLVVLAGSFEPASCAYVMRMGDPVRITNLAMRMAEFMGVNPDIVYTGLRPGEKLHEQLIGMGEGVSPILGQPVDRVGVTRTPRASFESPTVMFVEGADRALSLFGRDGFVKFASS